MSRIVQAEGTYTPSDEEFREMLNITDDADLIIDQEYLNQQGKNFVSLSNIMPEETNDSEVEILGVSEEDENYVTEEDIEYDEEVVSRELIEEIASVTTSIVKNVILDIDKITRTIFNLDKNLSLYQGIARRIGVERRGNNPQVNTFVSINFDFDKMEEKGLRIRGTEKLTPFDRMVLDAINTLYIEGHNEYITTQMVFHVMTGDENRRITPNYAEEINNSFIKLLFTHIYIDATEEAIMYPNLKNFKYHSTILTGDMVQAKLNGTEVACIHIYQKSILYRYASFKKQVSKIDLSIVRKPFTNDKNEGKEQMVILYYLLGRITALKRLSNRITYKTLYHEFGYDDAIKQIKLQFRKRVKSILDEWQGVLFGDILFIDYTEVKKGRSPYELILNFKVIKPEQALKD